MNFDEITLLLKALEHYETCGLAEDLEPGFKAELIGAIFGNGDNFEVINREAAKVADETRKVIDTRREQIVLLRAKLIGMKDKAFVEEL